MQSSSSDTTFGDTIQYFSQLFMSLMTNIHINLNIPIGKST